MGCADKGMLIPLALDDELDAAAVADLHQHLARCPDCARDWAQLTALRAALKRSLPRVPAPAALRARILADLPGEPEVIRWRRFRIAGMAAAGLALAAMVMLVMLPNGREEDRLTAEILAAHRLAVTEGPLTEIATADPAALRPFLAAHLAQPPVIPDLTRSGWTLLGGRLEAVAGTPVVALAYRRDAHVITLALQATPSRPDGESEAETRSGYAACHWTKGGVTFWAVGDVDTEMLERFEDAVTGQV